MHVETALLFFFIRNWRNEESEWASCISSPMYFFGDNFIEMWLFQEKGVRGSM